MQQLITLISKSLVGFIMLLLWCSIPVSAQLLLNPESQPRFVNPLPIPSVIDGRNGGLFTIGISQFDQWLGLIDPGTGEHISTTVWGYNGAYPGPTILATKDVPVDVFWRNNLLDGGNKPLPHLLPVDATIHWALNDFTDWNQHGVPVVAHLHGGHTESASDGLPDQWFTPNFALKGKGFIKADAIPYHYSNTQEAATLWYHDHALGITRLNVYAGLAGYYLLTDNNEKNLQQTGKLPAAPYDAGLVIQDRMFTENGKLYYPSINEEEGAPNPSILPEFFGNFILVNGMTWPVLDVEPRQYRFRVLNGSDSRFYNLYLPGANSFQQIGTDDGLLPSPVPLTQMLIAPGERKDIIIDFSDPALLGQTIIVRNNAKTPYPKGSPVNPKTTGSVMAFRVVKPLNTIYPLTNVPAVLRAPILPLQTTLPARKLILFEAEDEYDRLKPMLGTVDNGVLEWDDPITENPALNNTEIWEIYNETVDAHPIHLHMVSMQLINRQKIITKTTEANGKPADLRLVGNPILPGPDEQGWKDTWVAYPGEVTRVIAKFDIAGLYVWHCHILSHEDHEMMRPFFVGEMNTANSITSRLKDAKPDFEKQVQLQTIPNPFSSYFTLRFNMQQPGPVIINMFDTEGKLVKKVHEGMMSQGWQQFRINGYNLANGIYYLEVIINQNRMLRKTVLQK